MLVDNSDLTGEHEVGRALQKGGAAPKRRQGLFCSFYQRGSPLPCGLGAQAANEGRLVSRRVLAHRLANGSGITLSIQEIVHDLECQAESRTEFFHRLDFFLSCLPQTGACATRLYDQGAGLEGLKLLNAFEIELLPLVGEIDRLSADHSANTPSAGKARDQLATQLCIRMRLRIRQNREGVSQQCVADQDRRCFVEGAMNRRLASA